MNKKLIDDEFNPKICGNIELSVHTAMPDVFSKVFSKDHRSQHGTAYLSSLFNATI